jgi:RecA/RadA recombinase
MGALGEVAKRIDKAGGWAPVADVLTEVRSVPTMWPQLDAATRVGGWPLQRIGLVHGPSAHGKTLFCHGLGRSFVERGSFYFLIDAEFTTDAAWLRKVMGPAAESPLVRAMRPSSYEETVDGVRSAVELVAKAREAGDVAPETSALVVVDSIRKLVPEKLSVAIRKGADKSGIDGMKGRAAQIKAGLNAAWMDELVPLLYHTGTTLVLIARESEATDTGPYKQDWKLTGGKAIFYDSSLVCRIERASWVYQGSDEDKIVVGEKFRASLYKSKVAAKDGKATLFYFHTSNGRLTPEGFDRARDAVDLALEAGVLEKDQGDLVDSVSGEVLGPLHDAVVGLSTDDAARDALMKRALAAAGPQEIDEAAPC